MYIANFFGTPAFDVKKISLIFQNFGFRNPEIYFVEFHDAQVREDQQHEEFARYKHKSNSYHSFKSVKRTTMRI